MSEKDGEKRGDGFKTHVKEPHWQQIVSIIIVLAIIAVWIYFLRR